ncbi:DNA RNA non-specific endonuclease, partial [Brachionus plicatilis]
QLIFALQILLIGLAYGQLVPSFTNLSPHQNLIERRYTGFINWIDCNARLPVLFYYFADRDRGNYPRPSRYKLDPQISYSCQQKTTSSYNGGASYDRGHMVTANHMDSNPQSISDSNYITNIAPQTGVLNKGAWLYVEEVIECVRDIHALKVYGGIVMGNDASNDIFLGSHGVPTPDWYWKIVENTVTGDVIAWLMPNNFEPYRDRVDRYLTTVKDIENKSGFVFSHFTDAQRNKLHTKSWDIPPGCDFS